MELSDCVISSTKLAPSIQFFAQPSVEVLRIDQAGDIYWKGRLIEGDDEFKAAMLDLYKHFTKGINHARAD